MCWFLPITTFKMKLIHFTLSDFIKLILIILITVTNHQPCPTVFEHQNILHHQIHDIIGSSLWTCKYLISYLITRPIRYTSNTCWISFPLALYILIECVSSSYWANDGGRRVHWWRQTIKSLTSHIYKWSTAPFTNSSWYSLSDTMINILCYILTVGLMPVDNTATTKECENKNS